MGSEMCIRDRQCLVSDTIFTAGIADILKCFDQIIRPLLEAVLLLAGMPAKIVSAYMRYHDSVSVYNSLAGGYGKAYKKRCSIPQGCPFSMMFIALLMLPWVVMCNSMGLQPRVLADDIMLSTVGRDGAHFAKWAEGFDKTHEYVEDLGSKLAPSKSFTCSTDKYFRVWLRDHVWVKVGDKIDVKNHFRDLGAHLNLGGGSRGSTLTNRMSKALTTVSKIAWLPHSTIQKIRFIFSSAYSAGLYGCEATHVSEMMLARLSTAVCRVVGPLGKNRSREIAFALWGEKLDPDPEIFILTKRVLKLRRMICKFPTVQKMVLETLQVYTNFKHVGTEHADTQLHSLLVAPPPGGPNRQCWKPKASPAGPIGLLLRDLHFKAMVLNTDLEIRRHNEVNVSVVACPWQYLKPLVYQMANRSRLAHAFSERTLLAGTSEIDIGCLIKAGKKLESDQQRQLRYIRSLGDWNQVKLAKFGLDASRCPCGHEAQTWKHLILDCPRLDNWRTKHSFVVQLFREGLPKCMLQGLMPAMPLNPECTVENDNGTVAISLSAMHEHYTIPLGPHWQQQQATSFYRRALLHLGSSYTLNARQYLDTIRGAFGIPPTVLPSPCPPPFRRVHQLFPSHNSDPFSITLLNSFCCKTRA